jgi:hypothetical protein
VKLGVLGNSDRFCDQKRQTKDRPMYGTAMHFGLERWSFFVRDHGQKGNRTHVVFERRGKVEDDELELALRRIEPTLPGSCPLEIVFAPKAGDHCGHQFADLIARPIALSVIRPVQTNRAMAIIETQFRRSKDGNSLKTRHRRYRPLGVRLKSKDWGFSVDRAPGGIPRGVRFFGQS